MPEDDISWFRGGPFYRVQRSCHLVEGQRWNLTRRVVAVLAVAWLPLVMITALFRRDMLVELLKDYVVYSRIVIAIPALLIGHVLMDECFSLTTPQVKQAELLNEDDLSNLSRMIALQMRIRDSVLPELILVAFVFAEGILVWQTRAATAPAWAALRHGPALRFSAAGWYYGLVSLPIYQFLLGFSLWKWGLWSFFLFRLSRMHLNLVATHPDGHGGLGFLSLSPSAFAATAAAVSAAIGGAWRHEILEGGRRLASFEIPALVLVVLLFLVALAPLCFFTPRLMLLRKKAKLDYGVLAQVHDSDFHKRWVLDRRGPGKARIAEREVTRMVGLGISYNRVQRMSPFPIDKSTLIGFTLAALLPLVPVVLAEIPLSVILKGLLETVKAVPM